MHPSDTVESRGQVQQPQASSAATPIGILLNDLAHDTNFPFDLGGWTIDRATPSEIDSFRPQLAALNDVGSLDPHLPYEALIRKENEGRAARYEWTITPAEWRYTVLRPGGDDSDRRYKLDQALRISPADLRIGGWIEAGPKPKKTSTTFNVTEWVHWLSRMFGEREPQTPDLERVKEIVALRLALDEERYPNIARALKIFVEFEDLREYSNAQFLGQFAVLESLLSHNPDKHDPVDSITRQLKRNLLLLNHRMPPGESLGLSEFAISGQQVTAEQVIGKLYSIRSLIAHGGDPAKDEQWLSDRRPTSWEPLRDHVSTFMRAIARRVLVAALAEPQLVTDLRGT